jgi:hypothetical protein
MQTEPNFTENMMIRYYRLHNGSIFRYHGVMMLKKSVFKAVTHSFALGKNKTISVLMFPFVKVEVVKAK